MFKGLSKVKITALAVALGVIFMGMREEGTLASANGQTTYLWPVPESTQILKEYSEANDGIDIVSYGKEFDVIATRDGIVEVARSKDCEHINNSLEYCCNNGLGNYVKIKHKDGTYASYSHLKYDSVTVSEGETVEAGQVIGKMGASGRTDQVSLHFSVAYSPTKTINTNPKTLRYTYTSHETEQENDEKWMIVAKSGVNFRSGAGTSFQIIGRLEKATVVTIEETVEIEGSQWGKTTYDGLTGWFSMEYAQPYEGSQDENEESKERDDMGVRCQLLLEPNGGECEYSCYMYTIGSKVGELPTPTRSGYTFVGWYTEKNEGQAINSQDIINEDVTAYAHWK